jgi:hypothetical protein
VKRKWGFALSIFTLVGAGGALAFYVADPWTGLERRWNAARSPSFVRIELPPARLSDSFPLADLEQTTPAPESGAKSPERSDLPSPASARNSKNDDSVVPVRGNGWGGLLALDFDLADQSTADRSPVEFRKSISFNGNDAGQATIRVGAGSTLFIASEDLRDLLARAQRSDLAERLSYGSQSFVGFDEIRQSGLSLRYDAVSDRLLLSS